MPVTSSRSSPLLSIFIFGIASGFPWVMIGSVMSAWLQESGLSRSAIGYFGAVFVVYSVNFLWSPLIDRVRLPVLRQRLGQRRSWILIMQLLITAGCIGLSQISPAHNLHLAGLIALGVALCSATQDIAVDAFRIDSIPADQPARQSTASAMATSGWWTGYAGLGAVPFFLADNIGWSQVYLLLAAIMAVITALGLTAREPHSERDSEFKQIVAGYQHAVAAKPLMPVMVLSAISLCIGLILLYVFGPSLFAEQGLVTAVIVVLLMAASFRALAKITLTDRAVLAADSAGASVAVAWILAALAEPLREFFRRNGLRLALTLLAFVLLFKLGEAFLGRMSIVFYKEIGFSNEDIAAYSKLLTWLVTVVAASLCGALTLRIGLVKGLVIGGISMAASNLLFAWMAQVGPDKTLLGITIVIDGFTAAWGTVAFMSFISALCNRAFTASQYALLASIGTLGRVSLGTYSGTLVDALDGNWTLFFIITALMVIPSLLLLMTIRDYLQQLIRPVQPLQP